MNRARAALVSWLFCITTLAEARPFFDIALGADYASLGMALVAALVGGFIRTCWQLADRRVAVLNELRQTWRDMIYSLIAGGAIYGILLAVIALRQQDLSDALQAFSIVTAGALRLDFLKWLQKLTDRVGDAAIERAVSAVRGVVPAVVKPVDDYKDSVR
ncbi:MAG: hypothetical protein ABIQ60_15585 [Burkholderiaceae bacterium]